MKFGETMNVQIIPVTMFQSNCVIVWDDETRDGVVFDTGGDPHRIIDYIEQNKINVHAIMLTHGHVDHVSGTNKVKEATGARVYLHEDDWKTAEHTPRQCLMFGIPVEDPPLLDEKILDGDTFEFGTLELEAMHTPGHSPGSTIFRFTKEPELLIAGDLLFAGSIGRVDLPGGSNSRMKESLERIKQLPDDLVVISGHGPQTTIGKEKRTNPYLTGGFTMW